MEILYTGKNYRDLSTAAKAAKAHGFTHIYYSKIRGHYIIFKDAHSPMAKTIMMHHDWWLVKDL